MVSKIVIYIAGKVTDKTAELIKKNIAIAEDYGVKVALLGHTVILPHTMFTMDMQSALTTKSKKGYDRIMEMCLVLVERVDAILLLPNWQNSKGSKKEYKYALKLNKHIFYQLDEIPKIKN